MCFCHITVFIIYPGSFAQTSGVLTLLQTWWTVPVLLVKVNTWVCVSFTFNLVHSLPWSFNFNLMYYTVAHLYNSPGLRRGSFSWNRML